MSDPRGKNYERLIPKMQKKATPSDITKRDGTEGMLFCRCESVDTFVTEQGPTTRFNGRVRLDIPGKPGISITAGAAYLPGAADPIANQILDRFSFVSKWKHPKYGDAVKHMAEDGAWVEFALLLKVIEDPEAARGYVWEVSSLIDTQTPDDPMAHLVDRAIAGRLVSGE